jgi:hypothetical protein
MTDNESEAQNAYEYRRSEFNNIKKKKIKYALQ